MKLLICTKCGDVFNLQPHLKSCGCGETKGQYINNVNAEVNGKGVSLAIGNGSLWGAIGNRDTVPQDWRENHKMDSLIPGVNPVAVMCWVRQHEGPTNPHTSVNPDL